MNVTFGDGHFVCTGMRILPVLWACGALALAGTVSVSGKEFYSAGVRIHYTVQGQGEPLILIHGLYSSGRQNWDAPGITAALAAQFQVITFDLRGHGASDKPRAEGDYGVNMVEDVVRLMDHLHLQKARVAGYSLGAIIALKLVALHPDRVQSTVLGGMGWLRAGSPFQRLWQTMKGPDSGSVPPACVHGIAELAVSEASVRAVRTPVSVIVGDRDPCRSMYVEPLRFVRPDWPVKVIVGAGHVNCIFKPDFLAQLEAALNR